MKFKYVVKSDLEFLLKGAFKELAIAERENLKEGGSDAGKDMADRIKRKQHEAWKPKRGFTAKESGKIDQMIADEAGGKKTGEGSRGGKIIGHTASGKPKYAKGRQKGVHSQMDSARHGKVSPAGFDLRHAKRTDISREDKETSSKRAVNEHKRVLQEIKDQPKPNLTKGFKEQIPGGLAAGKKPKDFDAKQLKEGAKVEREHTSDKNKQKEIAMDHLTEDKKYYKKLKTIEKK